MDVLEKLRKLGSSRIERRERARKAAEMIRTARSYHWVGLYDVTPAEIIAIAWTGRDAPAFPRFPRTQGINGAAVAAHAPVIVNDVSRDERYLMTFGATRSEAIFPVAAQEGGQIVGTIDVESDRVDAFTADDESFLRGCAVALAGIWV